ncbi:hypothetical protein BO71DRAFT_336589, partial [Aspergillus ellipticus CBS 707.79]
GGNANTPITAHKQHTQSGPQNLYLQRNTDAPISLSAPNAAAPGGTVTSGFGVDEGGYLTVDGKRAFGVDGGEGVRKVYYLGDGDGGKLEGVGLWVKECKGC